MKDLVIRTATADDLDRIEAIETACFPPAEACSRESFVERLAAYRDHFWMGCMSGETVALVNGLVTDEPDLTDEMFADAGMHNPDGAWQMLFGVATLPEYRRRGIAGALIERSIEDSRKQGRKGLVLTCKDRLVGYYAKFGFVDEGITDKSVHGGAVWHQMRLTF